MRMSKALALSLLALAVGTVQASTSRTATLRISLTVVDRCDIRDNPQAPLVDCSLGVPWTVAGPVETTAPSLVADGGSVRHFPVPHSGPVDGARVTTIVF